MRRILKAPLVIDDHQTVMFPGDVQKFLTVQFQPIEDALCLWAETIITEQITTVPIMIFGTGNPIPETPKLYIDTVQIGPLVWHIYYDPTGIAITERNN